MSALDDIATALTRIADRLDSAQPKSTHIEIHSLGDLKDSAIFQAAQRRIDRLETELPGRAEPRRARTVGRGGNLEGRDLLRDGVSRFGAVPGHDLDGSIERDAEPDQVAVIVRQLQDDAAVRSQIREYLFHLIELLRWKFGADPAGPDVSHDDSSRCAGAGTPTERSVEVAADSAAGPAGAPLVPGRS